MRKDLHHNEDTCKWAIDSEIFDPKCHKDFCECVKSSLEESNYRHKRRKWASYDRFAERLEKNEDIKFEYRYHQQQLFVNGNMYVNPANNWVRFKGAKKRYNFRNKDRLFNFVLKQCQNTN
jgi:hypothetical protein